MLCPKCTQENEPTALVCSACGFDLQALQGDATGGVIPYKNPLALISYYLGILSGLPLIGFPLGIAAFILGVLGFQARRKNPVIKGSLHAGVGVGCGCFFTLFWGAAIVAMVMAIMSEM